MPPSPYFLDTSAPESTRLTKEYWLSSKYFLGLSPDSLVSTQTTTKPCSLNWSYTVLMWGISSRQGSHQVAQKSSRTGLPWKLARETSWPSTSFRVKPGAGSPRNSRSEGGVNAPESKRGLGGSGPPVSVTAGNLARRS